MLSEDSPDFFFLWSGDEFSHLFRMAVRSVRMHNPSADIRVYVTGRWPDSPNFEGMTSDGCASVIRIDADDVIDLLPAHLRGVADLYRKLPTHAHSARSNILRYALLYLHGGVYLDTDVLMLGAFPERGEADALIGTERVWKGDGDRVAGDASVWLRPSTWGWAVSWALTRADSLFFAGALGLAHRLARISDAWMTSQANNAVISARRESRFMERLLLSAAHADPSVRYSTGPTLIHDVLSGTAAAGDERHGTGETGALVGAVGEDHGRVGAHALVRLVGGHVADGLGADLADTVLEVGEDDQRVVGAVVL
ncbi:MAG: hypothetical protein EBS32_10540, partial [Actinobacteria bacterium]|nr:hypothetical protein [Actinomycetota bacterium]